MRSPETQVREVLRDLADEVPQYTDLSPRLVSRARRRVLLTQGAWILTVVGLLLGIVVGLRWSSREPTPADTPTPTPSAVTGPTHFESPLYGYTIEVPSGSTVEPAALTWEWGESVFELGEPPSRADVLVDPDSIEVGSWSWVAGIAAAPLPEGFTEEDWFLQVGEAFRRDDPGCAPTGAPEAVPLDGAVGRLEVDCDGRVTVTFTSQGRGYLVRTWEPFDSRMDLLSEMLATLRPDPEPVANPPDPTAWRGIYPQTTREGAEDAQRRADEGDPAFTWQVDPDGDQARWGAGDVVAMRFLEEVLGWEDYLLPYGGWGDWGSANLVFVRCEPGMENEAYPLGCAPADGNAFTTVLVRMERLVDPSRTGIWIVTRWAEVPAFEQVPPPTDLEVRDLVTGFMQARIAGSGAESYLLKDSAGVQLLYATSRGEPYDSFEIVRIEKPDWPDGWVQVHVRLLADGGNVVVEQTLSVAQRGPTFGLSVPEGRWIVSSGYTTENGEGVFLGG